MLSFEGVCSNPLGSWEQSVLLRSAYLYGSWYRFARTFFSNLLSIYFGSSGSKETQLAFLGFALSSPFSIVGIALGGSSDPSHSFLRVEFSMVRCNVRQLRRRTEKRRN